jgi:hypothetical protein
MFIFVLYCVGRGHYDELITRPSHSFYMSNKIKKLNMWGQDLAWTLKATDDDGDVCGGGGDMAFYTLRDEHNL